MPETERRATISVAMCTFNGAAHLADQLASIAAQDRPPDELVVCDDRSTDGTEAIAREFAAAAPFPVRVCSNGSRLGTVGNFENAIATCTGDIIALADQDDWWHPGKLARVEAAFANPDVGLVFSDAELVDEHLRPIGDRLWRRTGVTPARRRAIESQRALAVLWPGWFVTGATMAFRARYRSILLPIPDDLPMIHDGWIAAVVSAAAKIRAIDEPLIKYRQHPRQQIGAPQRPATGPAPSNPLSRGNDYRGQIAVIDRLSTRLLSQVAFPLRQGVAGSLAGRRRHLHARATLPSRVLERLSSVMVELATGRYHRYSNGLASAAKDLVAGHRLRRKAAC